MPIFLEHLFPPNYFSFSPMIDLTQTGRNLPLLIEFLTTRSVEIRTRKQPMFVNDEVLSFIRPSLRLSQNVMRLYLAVAIVSFNIGFMEVLFVTSFFN